MYLHVMKISEFEFIKDRVKAVPEFAATELDRILKKEKRNIGDEIILLFLKSFIAGKKK